MVATGSCRCLAGRLGRHTGASEMTQVVMNLEGGRKSRRAMLGCNPRAYIPAWIPLGSYVDISFRSQIQLCLWGEGPGQKENCNFFKYLNSMQFFCTQLISMRLQSLLNLFYYQQQTNCSCMYFDFFFFFQMEPLKMIPITVLLCLNIGSNTHTGQTISENPLAVIKFTHFCTSNPLIISHRVR